MPKQKKFKRRIRQHVAKTGKSYVAARNDLLRTPTGAHESGDPVPTPQLSATAETPRRKPPVLAEIRKRQASLSEEEQLAQAHRLRDLIEGTNPLQRVLDDMKPYRAIIEEQQRYAEMIKALDPARAMREVLTATVGLADQVKNDLGATGAAMMSAYAGSIPVLDQAAARHVQEFCDYANDTIAAARQRLAASLDVSTLHDFRNQAREVIEGAVTAANDMLEGSYLREIAALAKNDAERAQALLKATVPQLQREVDRIREEIDGYAQTMSAAFNDQLQSLRELHARTALTL